MVVALTALEASFVNGAVIPVDGWYDRHVPDVSAHARVLPGPLDDLGPVNRLC